MKIGRELKLPPKKMKKLKREVIEVTKVIAQIKGFLRLWKGCESHTHTSQISHLQGQHGL